MSAKPDKHREAVEKALHLLGEHFEAVQILATRTIEGSTHTMFRGTGNWHARMGLAVEFVNKDFAQENAIQIADRINPNDGGDE